LLVNQCFMKNMVKIKFLIFSKKNESLLLEMVLFEHFV